MECVEGAAGEVWRDDERVFDVGKRHGRMFDGRIRDSHQLYEETAIPETKRDCGAKNMAHEAANR
jgi:hypothetical protein